MKKNEKLLSNNDNFSLHKQYIMPAQLSSFNFKHLKREIRSYVEDISDIELDDICSLSFYGMPNDVNDDNITLFIYNCIWASEKYTRINDFLRKFLAENKHKIDMNYTLYFVLKYGRHNAVERNQIIIDYGGNVNHRDKEGRNLLHQLIECFHFHCTIHSQCVCSDQILNFLIKNNFNINQRDHTGSTALQYFLLNRYESLGSAKAFDIFRVLLEHGATCNEKDILVVPLHDNLLYYFNTFIK